MGRLQSRHLTNVRKPDGTKWNHGVDNCIHNSKSMGISERRTRVIREYYLGLFLKYSLEIPFLLKNKEKILR